MALAAVVPDCFVRTCVDGEIQTVVVESGRSPRGLAVTGGTIFRKLGGQVIGIGGLLVVLSVTTDALIRSVGVSVLMTTLTIIADQIVCTQQRINAVVIVKSGGCPSGRGGMTGCTILREV